ncbi:glycosyltransferase family 4 protein [Liquorilactobacillus hordei]|uniref:Glycosyl transferase family 1 domain-containing protein n=1 Tax=Liquorilactobacillus hordei DSM 19519 TaxID=1423759 RepID=A0A0R1MQI2_9LACO|nr:glycosyltransferase family 4 protein [Liquorilactobacillus hordei]KRL07490.1 hypothetical protein FC92_GL001879 [Liquorilactobacillus hordei DSM 19519]QYH52198.1 glycosyltransferase family 4 protein [Liquorilactobacillus hordei DSM 19519]
MNKKKLLIYAHYYAPDTASTGQILKELAEGMLDTFDITVVCVVPSYTGVIEDEYKKRKYYLEEMNGVKLVRVRVPEFSKSNKKSRIRNIVTYFIRAMVATLKLGKFDYIFSVSQPPILGGLLGVFGKFVKRAKFIYNIQDFNPEQIMAVGFSKNKFILKLMMSLDKVSCKVADKVVVVGRDMEETLEKRFKYKNVPKHTYINNWIDEKKIYPLDEDNLGVQNFKRKYELINKFVIMYSGNIGLYYDLENIIKVIEKFPVGTKTKDGRDVVFVFIGAGSVLPTLKKYVTEHKMKNVSFIPYQKKEDLIYSLNAADVHWCVNAKGIKGVSCPSKYYGIAAVAKPVLAVLEKDSEIELIIRRCKNGFQSEPTDYKKLENNLKAIFKSDSDSIKKMAYGGFEFSKKELNKEKSINRYRKNIIEIN